MVCNMDKGAEMRLWYQFASHDVPEHDNFVKII